MVRPSSTPSAVLESTTSSPGSSVLGLAVDASRRPRRRTCGSCGRSRAPRRRGRSARTCCGRAWRRRRARRSSPRRGRCRARARRRAPTSARGRRAARRRRRSPRGSPSTAHFSGSTTSVAPAAAAARVSRSAASRLRSRSAVELSCTAAALTAWLLSPPGLTRQSIPLRRGYRAPMRTPAVSAWRGRTGRRPGGPTVPLPPARMPLAARRAAAQALALGRRVLGRTRWRARRARAIGGVPVTWWAVWDGERLHERSQRRPGPCGWRPGTRAAPGVDLRFEESEGVEVVSPHGAQYIWTRKQGGIPMRGTRARPPVRGLRLRRRHRRLPRAPHRLALVGRRRHRRVGRARGVEPGRRRARRAERLGAHRLGRRHAAPRRAAARSPTTCRAVGDLRCEPVAVRAHRERLLVLASEYEMPFGRFSGSLPARREPPRGLGSIGAPRRPVVTCASRHKEALDAPLPADPAAPPPDGSRRRPRGRFRHHGALVHARRPAGRRAVEGRADDPPARPDAACSDLSPEIVTVNADGNRTTFKAKPTGKPGRYAATVRFPKAVSIKTRIVFVSRCRHLHR